MPGTRNRLINAARRSMLQRAQLYRKLDTAQAALRPKALVARGKYRLDEKIDDAAHIVRQEFRDNRLPITIAAVAGLAWLLREPIRDYAPRLVQKVQDLAEAAIDTFRPDAAEPDLEENDEAAE